MQTNLEFTVIFLIRTRSDGVNLSSTLSQIEEGGKAEQCKKLRVGDELVNINGSALYGSRQEALILIKGSYRILKITVCRRSVPVIRPHSWHLAKLSSTESPHSSTSVPPPPSPSPPSAMQLHPGLYTLPWHSTADNSDLSIQWNKLSRHYSTDRSSSLSSMDSLDPTSSQVYYDSHNSPVDPAIFNNKRDYEYHNSPVDPAIFNNIRDSAYSSFSASSNMSDYTVSLRPGEACSMENIVRSLGPGGPACRVNTCGNAPSLGRESGEAQDETDTSTLLLKSRSLTRPRVRQPEAKERPSSYCFEEERREGSGERGGGGGKRGASIPPLPPTRKDSFRATRGRLGITDVKDQRCISAPVGIPSLSSCHVEDDDDDPQNVPGVPVIPSWNGYPAPCKASKAEGDMGNGKKNGVGNFKGDSLEQYYTLISKKKDSLVNKNLEIQEIHPDSLHLPALEISSSSSISGSSSLPPDSSIDPEPPGEANHLLPQNKHCSSGLYRQSVPEKLLSQLRHLEFSSDSSDHSSVSPSSSQWSRSPLNPPREDLGGDIGSHDTSLLLLQQNTGEWEQRSQCSTPGLVDTDGIGEAGEVSVVVWKSREVVAAAGNCLSPIQVQHPWGRSVSVPGSGEPSGDCTQGEVSPERIWETDFGPLSAAASVDSLLEGSHRGGGRRDDNEGKVLMKKPRSHRSSRSRRRSERFATNLRNEIQHKKAQLSKSKGPGGLLYSGETVEEEGPDLEIQDLVRKEAEDVDPPAKESSSQGVYTCSDISLSAPAPGGLNRLSSSSTLQLHQPSLAPVSALQPPRDEEPEPPGKQDQATYSSRTPQRSVPTLPSWGMGIQVVEELAPAGKSRRWRWTPEHKLQPEVDTDRRGERVGVALGVSGRGRASSASSSSSTTCSSHTEESDILPFADRCKFFEETSRSILVSNLPGLTRRRQRPDRHEGQPHLSMLENQRGGYGQGQAQRRYSYQGGFERESPLLINTMEARRQSVSGNREREKEREKEREMEREVRAREREREREERAREREREREERATERERLLEREEMVREREREERAREREMALEGEREEERQREERARLRELEMERERGIEREQDSEMEKERQSERERKRERERKSLSSAQDLFASQSQPHAYPQNHSHPQIQMEAPRSAFHPVNTALLQDNQALHQGYPPQSYTPTEAYPAASRPLPWEQTQINRKFSLTERDYPRYRRDSSTGPPNCTITVTPDYHHHQQVSQSGGCWNGLLSACSVDEEDHHQTSMVVNPTSYSSSSLLRSRAMSENDLHFGSTHRRTSPSVAMATPLSELEEGGGIEGGRVGVGGIRGAANKNKTLPPPRPPPPKWEQFHRRRASHHTLLSSPLFSTSVSSSIHPLVNPTPPPLPLIPPEGPTSHPSSHPCHPEKSEMTRQRSYSLPPQREELEGCQRCIRSQVQEWRFPQSSPSPGFTHTAFRPVAPPQRDKDTPPRYNNTLPPSESCVRLYNMVDQDCPAVLKPISHRQQRARAEWERTPSPRVHSFSGQLTIENGVISPESYFAMTYEQQQQLQQNRRLRNHPHNNNDKPELEHELLELEPESDFGPSPAQSLEQEVDIPMETDIDDSQEEGLPEDEEPIRTELQGFALPVTVLETDIDTLPNQEALPAGRMTVENGSLDGEMEDQGMRTREELMEELFPQSIEGEAGTESWRGAYRSPNLEHNTDSLDRRSGASSSCSSYYSTSAAKAQLLTQMKDYCSDTRDTDDDDEDLSYKRQLMESLRKKLGILREAQRGLQEDIRANAQLGEEVESLVLAFCKPNEVDKFRMFIGDMDKVVSLLLSLSGRLLRVESSLDNLEAETGHYERLPLLEKKRQLLVQLSEAQDLKEHVDRREQVVGRVLRRCLSQEQHRDYSHYVKMKAALLVEQRQLEDKIRLGEEQLRGLRESLGMGLGMSMGYGHY
ncbi:protein Shroom4 isoform X3 [Oncorhynchus keta]|uniref:protein Shroom4 isoform X3 n=1 Tax=Oncorhynchus keta TaxID=8018 RepID=UPI00227B6E71|nr:protein Shroom4 isoform X3 [Oncorhynchus keta]